MNTIVAKFGGSSLANARQIRKVLGIIRADPARKYIVVSAPAGVTDELIAFTRCEDWDGSLDHAGYITRIAKVSNRFEKIVAELGIAERFDMRTFWDATRLTLQRCSFASAPAFFISRGEYLMGQILGVLLGYQFLDSRLFIRFDDKRGIDRALTVTAAKAEGLLQGEKIQSAVIPGFYGATSYGDIVTFPRGGSDTTGSIVAALVGADCYENWTNTPGVFAADPRIVENPRRIDELSFAELRELGFNGAKVFHHDAVVPVLQDNIPINIRNTNDPDDSGTMVRGEDRLPARTAGSILGIAGKTGLSIVTIEKMSMHPQVGFLADACSCFARHGVSIEHVPSGIGTVSVVVEERPFDEKRAYIEQEVEACCRPDLTYVEHGFSTICVVGAAMVNTPGVAAKVFRVLADERINVRAITQGASQISIVIAVKTADYEKATNALYRAYFG